MNLKSLSNKELDQNLMSWVKAEKKALHFVISHVAEVDRRKMSLYRLKKFVLRRDGCCQFKNSDGRVCGSKWNLQVDHIQPKWAGGKDDSENLRVLCGNHNRYVYRQQANIKAG